MTQKNLLIGAGLVTVGLVLAYRAEKKGKKVPVIGGLFRKSSSTEDAEVLAEAELEEEGEADVVNFSNAAGMRSAAKYSRIASAKAGGGDKPKKGDCFKANTGETCCYTGQGLDLRCTRGAAKAMTAARRARRTRRG